MPDKEILGLKIMEFAGNDKERIVGQIESLCQRLDELIAQRQGSVMGYQICNDLAGIGRIYNTHEKAVDQLSNA